MHAQQRATTPSSTRRWGSSSSSTGSCEQGSFLDYGMFLENVMVAARARGLDTCPQAAFMQFHRIIAVQLSLRRARWSCAA